VGAAGRSEFLNYARLLVVVDPSTGETTKELRAGRGNALLLRQSPDGQCVISANEKTVRLWDLVNSKLDQKFEPKLAPADQLAPGEYWASLKHQKFEGDYQNPVADAIEYSPDGGSVFVAQNNGFVLLLDAATGAQLKHDFAESTISNFAFSRDGKSLASAQVGAVPRLWDPRALTSRELEATVEDCASIAFSADARMVVGGGNAGVLLVWDAGSGALLARVLRTPEGQWLAVTPEGLFDGTPEGAQLATWRVGNRCFRFDQVPQAFRHASLLQELFAGERPKPKENLAAALGNTVH
jgi:WD40 repeat protein